MKTKKMIRLSISLSAIIILLFGFSYYTGNQTIVKAASTSAPAGYWKLDEGNGNTAFDASGHGNNATLNGASWVPGAVGGALSFNGTTNYAQTGATVLNTSGSFSVAAWVNLSNLNNWSTAVSQDGANISGFYLQCTSSGLGSKFAFSLSTGDSTTASGVRAMSWFTPQTGVWYHLVGVRDAAAGQITLYVNGQRIDTQPYTGSWNASGPLAIGRSKWGGAMTDFFNGQIDDVHAYNRVLNDSEIAALASGQGAFWGFDNANSTDASGNGNDATINGATSAPGISGTPNGSFAFNGTSNTVDTNKPLLNTNANYSVSAWVKLNNLNNWATAVSQDGTNISSFFLQYTSPSLGGGQGGRFALTVTNNDATSTTATRVVSLAAPQIGIWYHLVGVHDARNKTIKLYVNGTLQGSASTPTVWSATGETAIGRAKWGGSNVDFWSGQLDDIGVYNRVLTGAEIMTLAKNWDNSWASSMQTLAPFTGSNFSCRWIVRTSLAGSAVRVKLSNAFGSTSLTFNQVTVAQNAGGFGINAGTLRSLTFDGSQVVTIPAGDEIWSDPVSLGVQALEDLAVSTYNAGSNPPVSQHVTAFATSSCTDFGGSGGNHTSDTSGSAYTGPLTVMSWVTALDVQPTAKVGGAIVCFGDSITDGVGSNIDAHQRWEDILASRFVNQSTFAQHGIGNSGIGGNKVNAAGSNGPDGVNRLERDGLNQTGARNIIIFEGTNDIAGGATGDQVIAGFRDMIARSRQLGFKVIGGTMIPRDNGWGGNDAVKDSYRAQINQWIRTTGNFDAVIDFDAAVRDPNNLNLMLPAYDSGDHIHPSPAGFQAMGNSINLAIFQ